MPRPPNSIARPPSPDLPIAKLPQKSLEEFWESMICKTPGKVTTILPPSLYAILPSDAKPEGASSTRNAAASYEAAAEECKTKVARIVRECHRTNEKFTDPDFDLEADFPEKNCINGLATEEERGRPPSTSVPQLRNALTTLINSDVLGGGRPAVALDLIALTQSLQTGDDNSEGPQAVKRVDWIFDDPAFTVDGYGSTDVQQGSNGDCWWLAAVATLASMPGLMDRVCVARDAECGVYGFVFYRDGEWISTVVDDQLYISNPDFDQQDDNYDPTGEIESRYKQRHQTGSKALYYAHCESPNETWLPLLEKAYAKVHGDYSAISGGRPGEAVEDMTGGVTTTISTNKILSKDKLWKELLNVNKDFVFAAASPHLGSDSESRQGLALSHAYSILKAVEEVGEDDKKIRLVKIRNPWGRRAWNGMGEWSGPWSDGSKEWTPYWMNKLNHRFGDDGEFYMSFQDFTRKFNTIDRTRLFDKNWVVNQHWTSVSVSWISSFLATKFLIEVEKDGPVVLVLRQLDDRYFRNLEGQYSFSLEFTLISAEPGTPASEYIIHSRSSRYQTRSVSAELDLQPGRYFVLPKIAAVKDETSPHVETVVKLAAQNNPEKLVQIGRNYDVAHAKGGFEEDEKARKEREKRKREIVKRRAEEKEAFFREQDEVLRRARQGAYEKGRSDALAEVEQREGQIELAEKQEEKGQGEKDEMLDPIDEKEPKKEDGKDAATETKSVPVEPAEKSEATKIEEATAKVDVSTEAIPEKKEEEAPEDDDKEGSDTVVVETVESVTVGGETTIPQLEEEKVLNPEEIAKTETTVVKVEHLPEGKSEEKLGEEAEKAEEKEGKDEANQTPDDDEEWKEPSKVDLVDNPWNAVTVIGLLVYSRGAEAKITLINPEV
ncbi:hypothetical protein BGZ60DRAFT_381562 [Tricladium varicosporioides]|nr:hypothetical protein BGZ60DRAFT_381562 [Hymenoscyphus varicosporioides]